MKKQIKDFVAGAAWSLAMAMAASILIFLAGFSGSWLQACWQTGWDCGKALLVQ